MAPEGPPNIGGIGTPVGSPLAAARRAGRARSAVARTIGETVAGQLGASSLWWLTFVAIVYGSWLVTIPKMMRAGILFDVVGLFAIWIGLRILCPLLGLA